MTLYLTPTSETDYFNDEKECKYHNTKAILLQFLTAQLHVNL